MDYMNIKLLLKKYYNCEASEKEEQIIKEYFSQDNISDDLLAEKELFLSFTKLSDDSEPEDNLQQELTDLIENKWKESTRGRFRIIKWSIGIAASLMLAFVIYSNRGEQNIAVADTFTDEQQAYAATKEALLLVSEKMNMANNKLSSLKKINSNLMIINSLNKVDKMINKYKSEEK